MKRFLAIAAVVVGTIALLGVVNCQEIQSGEPKGEA